MGNQDCVQRTRLCVSQHRMQHGVTPRPRGNAAYFMPPYVIEQEHIDLMAQTARDGIHAATCD